MNAFRLTRTTEPAALNTVLRADIYISTGFLVTLLILLPAAAWQIFGPGIKKMMGQTPPPSSTP